MRRCDVIVLVLATSGCNQILGLDPTIAADAAPAIDAKRDLDLDRDGIEDSADPCIATPFDLLADTDGDSVSNATDDCPFDGTLGPDTDQDGVQDHCDPFPNLAGDRIRCVMVLTNPGLNARLWRQRPGDTGWNFFAPVFIAQASGGTIVSTVSIEAPTSTSFDITASLGPNTLPTAMFTLWLRTNDTPSPDDVGCRITGGATSSEFSIVSSGPPISVPVAHAFVSGIRLRATLEPAAAGLTVRCKLDHVTFNPIDVPALTAVVSIPPGNIGFTGEGAQLSVSGLMVLERATPAL